MKKQGISILVFLALVGSGALYRTVHASDHDDGEDDFKSRALNLTDHFTFTQATAEGGSGTNLVLVQNSNPRSLAGFQYFFSTLAHYEFHVTRVANKASAYAPADDVVLSFQFAAPAANNTQSFTMNYMVGGVSQGTATSTTTAYVPGGTASSHDLLIAGKTFKVFAGMRQDPFYFDVQRFFQVRANLAALASTPVGGSPVFPFPTDCTGGANILFNPASCAADFAKNFNVNSIVVSAPLTALQSAKAETTFDTWSIISVPQ